MRKIVLLAALLLVACGKNQSNVTLPPKQFDHLPLFPFQDIRLNYWKVDGYCRARGVVNTEGNGRLAGCAIRASAESNWIPVRVLPLSGTGANASTIAAITRHENGHLNGWPANHPGGRYE